MRMTKTVTTGVIRYRHIFHIFYEIVSIPNFPNVVMSLSLALVRRNEINDFETEYILTYPRFPVGGGCSTSAVHVILSSSTAPDSSEEADND